MASTSGRMLRLLSLLQTHRSWSGAELAERLDVSPRTLRRDVDRLRELGYPVDAVRGVAGGYQLRAGAALPPLLLDDEEAVAVAVGLRTAAGAGLAGVEETSVRALAKLVQVLPPRLRRRVDAVARSTVPAPLGEGPRVDAVALGVLAQACRDEERVRFGYTAKGREPQGRHVEPHRLVTLGRRWYLVAYDLERQDWRSFRVDRLRDPAATGARFRPRPLPADDAAAFVRAGLASQPTKHHVEVVVQRSAADVRAYVGRWGTVEPVGDGACRLAMDVDSLDWPAMVLGALDAPFEVVESAALVDYLRATAARFLIATEQPAITR